jgi:energy-coupling factor transporter ATP-binding protein EcfA2
LVNLVRDSDAEVFFDVADHSQAYVTLSIKGRRETLRLRSRRCRDILKGIHYQKTGTVIGDGQLRAAIDTLSGLAGLEESTGWLSVRVAGDRGRILYDLAGEDGRAIEVTAAGWRVVDRPTVRFWRPEGIRPLPAPIPGGAVDLLRGLVNVAEDEWPLLIGWIAQAMRPAGPYIHLGLIGEQGTGKSTLARMLKHLIDPCKAEVRVAPRESRDLIIGATRNALLVYDNMSRIDDWLADVLCILATGGGQGGRKYFTDDDETVHEAQRPVILTSITDVIHHSDLLDRTILIHPPMIGGPARRTEEEIWHELEEHRPAILGALLDGMAGAMERLPVVRSEAADLPRMADAALWAEASARAIGLPAGAFLERYAANRVEGDELALEPSPVVGPLLRLLGEGGYDGPAEDLLRRLAEVLEDPRRLPPGWPRQPHILGGHLRRIAPNLRRAYGIEVTAHRSNGRRLFRISAPARIGCLTARPGGDLAL